jgi:cell division protease FtsH
MVAQFGMSESIGPLNFGEDERQPFLGYSLSQGRTYSEETAAQIDVEVRRIVEQVHKETRDLLEHNRDKLDMLANELLTNESVDRVRVLEIAGVPPEAKPEPEGVQPTQI